MQKELKEMVKDGIATTSNSEWAAPIVLVTKKDGGIRFCVDYRRLNAVSAADCYPMPRVDELIDRLGTAKYISTLDLSRGYWQVPMSAESRKKTSFVTPFGQFEFNVMPFGLHGAPSTFQRMMDQVLQGLETWSAAYIDDVVVQGATWSEHITALAAVLKRLQEAGLTAKSSKCHFVRHGRMHLLGPHRGKWARSTGERQSSSSGGVPGAQDEEGRESISRPHRILPQVHPGVCYHCSPTDRAHQERAAQLPSMELGVCGGIRGLKTTPVYKSSAKVSKFRTSFRTADGRIRLGSWSGAVTEGR